MTAGIPGIGISAIVYLVVAFWLPIREVFRAQHSRKQWLTIGRQFVLMNLMLLAAWGESEAAAALGFVPLSATVRTMPVVLLLGVLLALELVRALTRKGTRIQ